MPNNLIRTLAFPLLIVSLAGCSQDSVQPDATSSGATTASVIDNELALLRTGGIGVDSSRAVFSLGWREFLDPRSQAITLTGRAFAVAFTHSRNLPVPHSGMDMGSVFLNYNGVHVELQKRIDPRRGISYSTFSGPREGGSNTNVQFVANEPYEFEVTGSDSFSAFRGSVVSPAALFSFVGDTNRRSISATSDLTLRWSGGNASDGILLAVMPFPPAPLGGVRPPGDPDSLHPHGPGGMHPGDPRRGPGGGPGGPGDFNPPPPIDSTKAIIVKLQDNPGTYTIPAGRLQGLVNNTGARAIVCVISQLTQNTPSHDGGTVRIVLANEDHLHLIIQP